MGAFCGLPTILITVFWGTYASSIPELNTTLVVHSGKSTNSTDVSSNCTDFPWSDKRLPLWIEPEHYVLHLHPNITGENFTGSVDIEINVKVSTDLIVLNSKELNIVDVKMKSDTGEIGTKKFLFCTDRDQLAVPLQQKIQPNKKYTLSLKFWGELTEKFGGLYKTFYITEGGQKKYLAVTQFESTDARTMLPCWDEPRFKAYFTVKVTRNADMLSLSNTGVVEQKNLSDGLIEDVFEKTVKMSTYLLAVVICDFGKISGTTSNGVKVSIYAPVSQTNQSQWALNISMRGLEYYEKFFKIKYPLKKLDLILVPDFVATAMENWGLITFLDTNLLYDTKISATLNEEDVAIVTLHEIAHQWFGNLVTMKWWNDTWLNEGFANFFQIYATDQLEKGWNLMDTFISDNVAPAMNLDGLVHTHPMSVPVNDPDEIDSLFDDITYCKGASVLRMVMGVVGEVRMKDGLSEYLNTYKYSNTEGKDLWNVINKYAPHLDGLNMVDFTTNFTEQPGYPLVTIESNNGKLCANQTRFFFLQEEMEKPTSRQLWHIHLTVTTDSGKNYTQWMKREKEITFELKPTPKWYKANVDTNGFYRVIYDNKNWKALIKQLQEKHDVFTSMDRAGLLNDVFAFLLVGLVDVDVAFEFFNYLPKETARGPWDIVSTQLSKIESNLRESETYLSFMNYVKSLLSPIYKSVGWKQPVQHEAKLVQQEILDLACKFDVGDCRVKAIQQFQDFLKNIGKLNNITVSSHNTIAADHRTILCGAAIQNDSGTTWDTVFKLYNTTNVPSEKVDYLQCLGFSNDPWRLSRLLEMTLDESKIRHNLMPVVINQVVSNINGKYLSWRFIQSRYEKITNLISPPLLSDVIKSLGSFNTKFDYDQINSFFKDKKLGSNKPVYEQTMEGIQINIQFMKLNEEKIKKYLNNKGFSALLFET